MLLQFNHFYFTPVFSATWSLKKIILIFLFGAQETFPIIINVKIFVLLNIFVEILIHLFFLECFDGQKVQKNSIYLKYKSSVTL